jgi:hypothetical protein
MSVIDLASRRPAAAISPAIHRARARRLTDAYTNQGRDLAELAHPIIEPFRQCEPSLEQHLKGAFLRWQMEQIKTKHHGDAAAIGLALAVTVEAFTDRLVELQYGFDPNGGDAA